MHEAGVADAHNVGIAEFLGKKKMCDVDNSGEERRKRNDKKKYGKNKREVHAAHLYSQRFSSYCGDQKAMCPSDSALGVA